LRVGDTLPSGGTHLPPAPDGFGGDDALRTVAGQHLPEVSYLSFDPFLLSFKPVDCGSNNVVCHRLFRHISFVGHSEILVSHSLLECIDHCHYSTYAVPGGKMVNIRRQV
jgi:hypothetical protein